MVRDLDVFQVLGKLKWESTYQGFQDDVAVIDVAELSDFNHFHIPWSLHLPIHVLRDGLDGAFEKWVADLLPEPGMELIVYGRGQDKQWVDECLRRLQQNGYPNLYRMVDGFETWLDEVLPTESLHEPVGSMNVKKSTGPKTVSMKDDQKVKPVSNSTTGEQRSPAERQSEPTGMKDPAA